MLRGRVEVEAESVVAGDADEGVCEGTVGTSRHVADDAGIQGAEGVAWVAYGAGREVLAVRTVTQRTLLAYAAVQEILLGFVAGEADEVIRVIRERAVGSIVVAAVVASCADVLAGRTLVINSEIPSHANTVAVDELIEQI